MGNTKTTIDEWEVKDLEDNSSIRVYVSAQTEMGNKSLPGLQVLCSGKIVNYEPLHVERWLYAAKKQQATAFLVEDGSWTVYDDTYIKQFLIPGSPLKVRIEVKVRSKEKVIVREYELPFTVEG